MNRLLWPALHPAVPSHAGVRFVRLWLPMGSAWAIYRHGEFKGTALRQGSHWLAALPDPDGHFLLDVDGCARWFRRRRDALLALFMAADGIEP